VKTGGIPDESMGNSTAVPRGAPPRATPGRPKPVHHNDTKAQRRAHPKTPFGSAEIGLRVSVVNIPEGKDPENSASKSSGKNRVEL
jgi:hypothetical protein